MFSLIKYEIKKFFSHKIIPILLLAVTVFNVLLISSQMDEKVLTAEKQVDDFLLIYEHHPTWAEEYIADFNEAYNISLASMYSGERVPFPDNLYTDNDYIFFNDTFADIKDYTKNYQKTVKKSIRIAITPKPE